MISDNIKGMTWIGRGVRWWGNSDRVCTICMPASLGTTWRSEQPETRQQDGGRRRTRRRSGEAEGAGEREVTDVAKKKVPNSACVEVLVYNRTQRSVEII